jgi:antitoxin component YwqK of YwqJK toxin-antitoxin module
MKKLLAAMFVALLMVGCGGPDLDDKETLDGIIAEAIDVKKLQRRGKKGEARYYAPNQQTPYSGWIKGMYDNGQIARLGQYKDGKAHGLTTMWLENGQKVIEANWKDGKRGLRTQWYENGQKHSEMPYIKGKLNGQWIKWGENGQKRMASPHINGKKDGITNEWYEDGQRASELNYKEGKLITAKVWKPNGEKCPVTDVKDGNGIVLGYASNEKERILSDRDENRRWTYKDGEPVY